MDTPGAELPAISAVAGRPSWSSTSTSSERTTISHHDLLDHQPKHLTLLREAERGQTRPRRRHHVPGPPHCPARLVPEERAGGAVLQVVGRGGARPRVRDRRIPAARSRRKVPSSSNVPEPPGSDPRRSDATTRHPPTHWAPHARHAEHGLPDVKRHPRQGAGDDDPSDDDDNTTACPEGETEDCGGNCAPADWNGDGECDAGQYTYEGNAINFNCEETGWDGGDCPGGDDDDDDGDPCNPAASVLDCDAPGAEVGGSGWEAVSIPASLDSCGDYNGGQPATRSLPDDVVSAYVGITQGGGGQPSLWWLRNGSLTAIDNPGGINVFANSGGGGVGGFEDPVGVVMPMTPTTDPSPGCLVVWPGSYEGTDPAEVLMTVRSGGAPQGLIDINIGIVQGVTVGPEDLEEAMYAAANSLYGATGEGADLYEAWSYFEVNDSSLAFLDSGGAAIDALRATRLGDNDRSVNLYVVQDFDDGILGIAGGIPGPLGHQGTVNSGVVIAVNPHLDGDGQIEVAYLAATIIHELGHQIGLYHTTESGGATWDPLPDTAQCSDPTTTPSACPDGTNIMFWTGGPDDDQTVLSQEQANVYVRTPVLR